MADTPPLADVKIVDFMWVAAGPAATRVLADYGATVVRVESACRPDTSRTLSPFLGLPPEREDSVLFHNMNAGKRMLALDLGVPAGRAVALDLVRWADVVAESFSPKAMRAWGLDYPALRAVKSDVIMVSTCLMGQTGPLAGFAGFGNLAAAITGFTDLCGWPDRPPAGPFGAYTDYIAPRYITAVVLAALDHRRRTGEGQFVDLSQAETALHFLAPATLDYTVNGRVQRACGNRDRDAAPHAVYPAAGDNRWIAIAVHDDAQFAALCDVIGRGDLATEARFATAEGRRAHQDALDEHVAAWSRRQDAHAAERALQARGVPASAVQNSRDLLADPQLAARGHFVRLTHPTRGSTMVEGSRFRLSRTPAQMPTAAPTLGRDTADVLRSLLGYGDARIAELEAAGVLA
ncbi:MAG TPA: CoA transferase [Candidatus Elarobacter sp.]|nr:CoA transferase [Candidatus Elarobacter sp.]